MMKFERIESVHRAYLLSKDDSAMNRQIVEDNGHTKLIENDVSIK